MYLITGGLLISHLSADVEEINMICLIRDWEVQQKWVRRAPSLFYLLMTSSCKSEAQLNCESSSKKGNKRVPYIIRSSGNNLLEQAEKDGTAAYLEQIEQGERMPPAACLLQNSPLSHMNGGMGTCRKEENIEYVSQQACNVSVRWLMHALLRPKPV